MDRRTFVLALAAGMLSSPARSASERANVVRRVGVLYNSAIEPPGRNWSAFLRALGEEGSFYLFRQFAVAGGLIAYGPDHQEIFGLAAYYVDKILKGTNPAELSIEQPRKPYLVINRTTANTLALKLPPALQLQADQVIQ